MIWPSLMSSDWKTRYGHESNAMQPQTHRNRMVVAKVLSPRKVVATCLASTIEGGIS